MSTENFTTKKPSIFRVITIKVLLLGVLIPGGGVALLIYLIYLVFGAAGESIAAIMGIFVAGPLVFLLSLLIFLRELSRLQKLRDGVSTNNSEIPSTTRKT